MAILKAKILIYMENSLSKFNRPNCRVSVKWTTLWLTFPSLLDSSVDQTLQTSSFNFQLSSSWKPNVQLSQMTQIYRKLVVTILKALTWNLPILNDPNKYKSVSKLNKLLGSLFYKYGNLLYISTYITQIYNRKTLKRQSI